MGRDIAGTSSVALDMVTTGVDGALVITGVDGALVITEVDGALVAAVTITLSVGKVLCAVETEILSVIKVSTDDGRVYVGDMLDGLEVAMGASEEPVSAMEVITLAGTIDFLSSITRVASMIPL